MIQARVARAITATAVLEDANAIQVGLVEVTRLLVTQQIDHRTAGLLLYALQTASANLKYTSFEPEKPTRVVIDRGCVGRRPIGATAWSMIKGREFDDLEENKDGEHDSLARILLERMGLAPELFGEPHDKESDEASADDEEDHEEGAEEGEPEAELVEN